VRLPVVALLTAGLLAATPPAGAQTWAGPDPRGDVRVLRYQPDAKPCAPFPEHRNRHDKRHDIRELAVDNGLESVVLTVSLREVDKRDRSTIYYLHVRTPKKAYSLNVGRFAGSGGTEVFLSEEPHYPNPSQIKNCSFATDSGEIPCEGLAGKLSPQTDQLLVTIPASCLSEPAWVRVAAELTGFTKPDAFGRFTMSTDFWAPRGVKRSGFLPPFGPRVHSS